MSSNDQALREYVKRYNLDTLSSTKRIKIMGIGRMMGEDSKRRICPKCGRAVKFQNHECSECGFQIN